ncbi:MAG: CPBP family intramembrane metalloprotease [Pirellulales bacterium]|nr:CPBP family intramembrane metalloprotease [Pirellulales bacterium]
MDRERLQMESQQSSPSLAWYHQESRRPLASLVFVIPILVVYEAGGLMLGPQAMRNAADGWLRELLRFLGFGQYFLLPLLTCAILLGWHHLSGKAWRVASGVVSGMWVESAALAVVLVIGARGLPGLVLDVQGDPDLAGTWLDQCVSFMGAGIYEELLFRLMLLPAVIGLFKLTGVPLSTAVMSAVILTSLLFSAAHYDWFLTAGEPFEVSSFVFRTLAGGFFSGLFLWRGFGIAVGTHALYDIFVTAF